MTIQALWFNRRTVSLSEPPPLPRSFFLLSFPVLLLSSVLPSLVLLTSEGLLNEALTKSELMNYSNTYNVIIVINGPTHLPSHRVSKMNVLLNVFLLDKDLKLLPCAIPSTNNTKCIMGGKNCL